MPNIGDIISLHNKAILHQSDRKTQTVDKLCNCRNPSTCPLEGRYEEGQIVYKATLTSQNKAMAYYGSCETEFKSRYNNRKQSLNFKDKKHATQLSKTACQRRGGNPIDRMERIVKRMSPYQCGYNTCQLCLGEKMVISQADKKNLLNK